MTVAYPKFEQHGISAQVILASAHPWGGPPLYTLQLRLPRIILAEFNTHRAFSRNARSTRAVPTAKLIQEVRENPFAPILWGLNQKGMQAGEIAGLEEARELAALWKIAANDAAKSATDLFALGLHKQWAGRPLEPYLWTDVLVSSTEWSNFFALRMHEAAQPEFQVLANLMFRAIEASPPGRPSRIHGPYMMVGNAEIDDREADAINAYVDAHWPNGGAKWQDVAFIGAAISARRCGRVSYKPFDGEPATVEYELKRFLEMANAIPMHASPMEHVAIPDRQVGPDAIEPRPRWEHGWQHGNFTGWRQLRHIYRPGMTSLPLPV